MSHKIFAPNWVNQFHCDLSFCTFVTYFLRVNNMFSFQIFVGSRRQSSWASCEFSTHRRRDADATQLDSWVASAVCIVHKSCYSHIRELRYIRSLLTSIQKQPVPSLPLLSTLTLSLYYNLPYSQINRLQQIQNCLARTVVKAHKSHITPSWDLCSLHWLKINERIEYKLLSFTYKVFTTSQPDYLHNLFSLHV